MRNMNATKKGPGRRPQTESSERHEQFVTGEYKPICRDYSGAKNARKAKDKKLTIRH